MARKRCCGLVEEVPYTKRFVPDNQKNTVVTEICIEEVEALRLKDIEGLDQQLCAEAMGVSRATFQRILQRARSKVASALVYGQTILIKGGSYMMKNRVFECLACNYIWDVEPCEKGGKHGYEIQCPECGSLEKMKISDEIGKHPCDRRHHHDDGCCSGGSIHREEK